MMELILRETKTLKSDIVFFLVMLTMLLSSCALSDHPCDDCGRTPTKHFKTITDEDRYYCRDYYSTCWLCGKRATKHYTNYFEMIMFVCDECYDEIVND